MRYVGLTDDPEQRRAQHGDPTDWKVVREFTGEREARNWEKSMLRQPGYTGGPGGKGWRYGYIYTVTRWTNESA